MNAQINPEQGRQTVIDTKFPLTWLIGCTCAVVFTIGGYAVQASNMVSSLDKLSQKMDKRDEAQSLIQQNALIQQGQLNVLAGEVKRSQADITDVKRDIEEMKRKQTWAPK